MSRYLCLVFLALPGCSGLMDIVADPAVRDGLIQTAESAATGNWLGAIWGIGATVAAIAGHQTVKHVKAKKQVSTIDA